MSERPPIVVRLVKGFGRFWWDFLVGDTPELFVAVVVIIGVIALLERESVTSTSPRSSCCPCSPCCRAAMRRW